MKAWVLHKPGDLRFEEIPVPEPKEDEVLLKVRACGICGSDVPRVFETGAHNMPLVPGHEFAGVVERAGSAAHAHWEGKRVTVFPLIACGECAQCRRKHYEMCENYDYIGSRRDGAFAEYVCVPAKCLMEIPDGISFEEAAMTEPMAVAVHAMRMAGFSAVPATKRNAGGNAGKCAEENGVCYRKHNRKIFVYGAGTIGLLLSMFLKQAGCENLYIIGNKEFQREQAKKAGIPEGHFCNSKETDVTQFVLSRTSGAGADVIFECIGKSETAAACIDLASPGGTVVLVGNPHSDMQFRRDTYWKILRRQLTIRGTWNSSFTGKEDDDWHAVKDALARGGVCPEILITHRFSSEQLQDGLLLMRDKTEPYSKVIIQCFRQVMTTL